MTGSANPKNHQTDGSQGIGVPAGKSPREEENGAVDKFGYVKITAVREYGNIQHSTDSKKTNDFFNFKKTAIHEGNLSWISCEIYLHSHKNEKH